VHDTRAVREDSVCAGFARIKSGRRVCQSGAFKPITRDVVGPGKGTTAIKLLDKHGVNDVRIGYSVWIAACVEKPINSPRSEKPYSPLSVALEHSSSACAAPLTTIITVAAIAILFQSLADMFISLLTVSMSPERPSQKRLFIFRIPQQSWVIVDSSRYAYMAIQAAATRIAGRRSPWSTQLRFAGDEWRTCFRSFPESFSPC